MEIECVGIYFGSFTYVEVVHPSILLVSIWKPRNSILLLILISSMKLRVILNSLRYYADFISVIMERNMPPGYLK